LSSPSNATHTDPNPATTAHGCLPSETRATTYDGSDPLLDEALGEALDGAPDGDGDLAEPPRTAEPPPQAATIATTATPTALRAKLMRREVSTSS
jgi:hypothetical protein